MFELAAESPCGVKRRIRQGVDGGGGQVKFLGVPNMGSPRKIHPVPIVVVSMREGHQARAADVCEGRLRRSLAHRDG